MVLEVATIIIVSVIVLKVASRVTEGRLNHEPLRDSAEKPKRGHLILSDDGELLEVENSESAMDEKAKHTDSHTEV